MKHKKIPIEVRSFRNSFDAREFYQEKIKVYEEKKSYRRYFTFYKGKNNTYRVIGFKLPL